VEFVASRIATVLDRSSNQCSMSSTAASAAALRAFSPSVLVMSKKFASGCGVASRRYFPTLKTSARIDIQPRYRFTARKGQRGSFAQSIETSQTFASDKAFAPGRQPDHDKAYLIL
jgi:hypothetical protein